KPGGTRRCSCRGSRKSSEVGTARVRWQEPGSRRQCAAVGRGGAKSPLAESRCREKREHRVPRCGGQGSAKRGAGMITEARATIMEAAALNSSPLMPCLYSVYNG